MHFENKVVWIIGASSGIGTELGLQLARLSAKLILTARNEGALNDVRNRCLHHTEHCLVLPADIMQGLDLPRLTERAIAAFGFIDMVIFSAGKSQRSTAFDTQMNVYRDLMELNFFAPVQLTKLLLPHFQKNSSGHIVAISSIAGLMGFPMRSGYSAAKHALNGYFETLQTENTIPDLHITIVSPGRVNTPISLHALTADGSPHGIMDEGQKNGIPVTTCAGKIITAIRDKKKHLLIAQNEKILWWLWWFVRPLYYYIARKKGLNG